MQDMKYTEALKKVFEVMEGRPDIKQIKFDRENDSFDVISDSGTHVCFSDEFRTITKNEFDNIIDEMIKTVKEWKANTDVISCETVISMLAARKMNKEEK